MAPPHDPVRQCLRDHLLPKEKSENLSGEHLSEEAIIKSGDVMEVAIPVFTSLCYQEMGMGVKVDFLSEGLAGGHHAGAKLSAGCGLEVFKEGLDGRLAEVWAALKLPRLKTKDYLTTA